MHASKADYFEKHVPTPEAGAATPENPITETPPKVVQVNTKVPSSSEN